MKAADFMAMMAATRKRDAGESLTDHEMNLVAKHDKAHPKKKCGCGSECEKLLEPRIDGERPTISGKEVNPDCYYATMGDELEAHPIGRHGIRRRA